MINLTKHSVNGKISVKSLVKTFDEYQAKEKELASKMFHLRGVFPRPEEYIELRSENNIVRPPELSENILPVRKH